MSDFEIGIIGFVLFFLLLFLNIPIGIVMASVGFIGFSMIRGFDAGLSLLSVQAYRTASDFVLGVIPLFVCMGFLALRIGLSSDLFYVMNKWIGHLRGGLAMATTGACTIFGAICGDAVATSAAIGVIALPEMRKYKYKDILSTGIIASAGNLGMLIPPSLGFIIYAIITEQSIGILFTAGILPGILLATLFIATILTWSNIDKKVCSTVSPASWKERFTSLRYLAGSVIALGLVLGGIYTGTFTATEGAAVGVFIVFMVGLVFRRITWGKLTSALGETALLTGKIFLLIIGAMIFTRFVTVTEIPLHLSNMITTLDFPPLAILLITLLFYIAVGFIADLIPIILITAPVLHPMLVELGYDPVWLAVMVVITICLAGITPPVGMVVYALSGMIKDVPMSTIFKGVMPFVAAMIVCLGLLIAFPEIALFLVK